MPGFGNDLYNILDCFQNAKDVLSTWRQTGMEHLKIPSHANKGCQVHRDLVLLSLYMEPYKANRI